MTIQQYDEEIAKRNKAILAEVEKARTELKNQASLEWRQNCKNATEENEAPCTVCDKLQWVEKYRNVNGYVDGEISGGLFWTYGRIKGETKTDAVLSCRNCGNEKLISEPEYISNSDLLKDQLPSIYNHTTDYRSAGEWLQEKGTEVALALVQDIYIQYDFQNIELYTESELNRVGLFRKYPLPSKPFLYSLRKLLNLK
jgi:hypothetical protein